MSRFWMVRAGRSGYVAEDFERVGCVAIGWGGAGDLTPVDSLDAMKALIKTSFPDNSPQQIRASAGMAWKFRGEMTPGDRVVTYDPSARQYLIGTVDGDYRYEPDVVPDHNHVRDVTWKGKVSRDDLSQSVRNSLGSVMTLFEPGEAVLAELDAVAAGDGRPSNTDEERLEEVDLIRQDVLSRAHEFIKDRILALSPEDMEELTASLLRAMGYRARVSPTGPDRGRDVVASPDGLGFQEPRIIAEVKHRRQPMGADSLRSFLGGLRGGDRGLYVSTGGFSREAKYEAERANVPVMLVDLDELARLVVEHYDGFDADGRALLPLKRVYWPVG